MNNILPPSFSGHPVWVIGLGAYTPVGKSAPASAAAIRADISQKIEHPYMIDNNGAPFYVCQAPLDTETYHGSDRLAGLALPAIQEALGPYKAALKGNLQIPLYLGLPSLRPGIDEETAPNVVKQLKDRLYIDEKLELTEVLTLSNGHSAGLMAMEMAFNKIRTGEADICLAGGVDSYLIADTLEWLDQSEQICNEKNPWGFTPGEAACFCLLASSRRFLHLKTPKLARLKAISTTYEKNTILSDSVCTAQGLTLAWRYVLQSLDRKKEVIDSVIGDMNGHPYRADEYGFSITRLSEFFSEQAEVITPAECWGDVGAASGPLFIDLIVASALRGYAKGPLGLIWTSSINGERCSAVIDISETQAQINPL